MAGRWDTLSVAESEMRCYLALPGSDEPHAAVVVAQHAGGVDEFIQTMSDRLAESGFVAIAPELYHRDDPAKADDASQRMARLRDRNIDADVRAAVAHLRTLREVRGDRIGITGFCMGGRVAYMMAEKMPELRAAVVFYGGHIMNAWGDGPTPFEQSSKIGCPVLGLFGAEDRNPTPEDVEKLDAELTRLGKTHEFHSYPATGHAFMSEGRPSYREDAARDAWPRCVDWFTRHLA